MAFNRETFSGGIGAGSNAPILFTHIDSTTAILSISASGYFNDVAGTIKQDDVIISIGSDGGQTLHVTSARGVLPVTTAVI